MNSTVAPTDRSALEALWSRLGEGEHTSDAIRSLCGVSEAELGDLTVLAIAGSAQAQRLLETAPDLIHGLLSTMSTKVERCVGQVYGPILWSETLNARAHTLGGDDVFVCGVQARDFDVKENQVLRAALDLVARAAGALDREVAARLSDDRRREIARRAAVARSLRGNGHLAEVRRLRLSRATLHKVQRSRRAKQYAPALEVLQRRSSPFDATDLTETADPATLGQLRALNLVLSAVDARASRPVTLRCDGIEAIAGPVRYRNWRNATTKGRHGVLVGGVLVDGPVTDDPTNRAAVLASLDARAAGQPYCLVSSPEEAAFALDLSGKG